MLKQLGLRGRASSRTQIAIKEVRDDILIMPNGWHASVVQTSSVNFELKSEEEQDVLIEKYAQFLNSLPQNIQIMVRVRELDINSYLDSLCDPVSSEYPSMLEDYKQFVTRLVSGSKIMTRRFYVILPHQSYSKDFLSIKEQVSLNTEIVCKQLEKLQMKAIRVSNIEFLNLFYEIYNPNKTTLTKLQVIAKEKIQESQYAI